MFRVHFHDSETLIHVAKRMISLQRNRAGRAPVQPPPRAIPRSGCCARDTSIIIVNIIFNYCARNRALRTGAREVCCTCFFFFFFLRARARPFVLRRCPKQTGRKRVPCLRFRLRNTKIMLEKKKKPFVKVSLLLFFFFFHPATAGTISNGSATDGRARKKTPMSKNGWSADVLATVVVALIAGRTCRPTAAAADRSPLWRPSIALRQLDGGPTAGHGDFEAAAVGHNWSCDNRTRESLARAASAFLPFVTTADPRSRCSRHTGVYLAQLNDFKLWATKSECRVSDAQLTIRARL